MLLKKTKQWITEEVKEEIKKEYPGTNEMKTMIQNL